MIPYLLLREPSQEFSGKKGIWLKILDSRIMGVCLSLITVGLLTYAMLSGDWGDFVAQWHNFRSDWFNFRSSINLSRLVYFWTSCSFTTTLCDLECDRDLCYLRDD